MKYSNVVVTRRFVTGKYEHVEVTLEASFEGETAQEGIGQLNTSIVNWFQNRGE